MPNISLQFSYQPKGLISDTLAWLSSSEFNHVDAILEDGRLLGARSDNVGGPDWLDWSGVRIRPRNYVNFELIKTMEVPATKLQYDRFYDFLKGEIGQPHPGNIGWKETVSWNSSDLIATAGEFAGLFVRSLYVAKNGISPVDLALVFSAIGGHMVEVAEKD
jgi:hypothetical protein